MHVCLQIASEEDAKMAGLSPEERKKLKLKARKVSQQRLGPYCPTPLAFWSAAMQYSCKSQPLLRIPYVPALRCTSATQIKLLSRTGAPALLCCVACGSLLSAVEQETAKKQKQANEVKAAAAAEAQQRAEEAKEKGKKGGDKTAPK